jgi:arginine decarboxylase
MINQSPIVNAGVPAFLSRATLYNLPRFRTDCWNLLRDNARRLWRLTPDDPEAVRLCAETTEMFSFLESIECYRAFPGLLPLAQLRATLAEQDYDLFAHQSTRLVRLLTTHAYRRLDLSGSNINDYADLLNVENLSSSVHSRLREEQRPYFEVLFVDELLPPEEAALRTRLRSLRRSDDSFIYEVVICSSFEDALQPDWRCCARIASTRSCSIL